PPPRPPLSPTPPRPPPPSPLFPYTTLFRSLANGAGCRIRRRRHHVRARTRRAAARSRRIERRPEGTAPDARTRRPRRQADVAVRSEEHTSELQSPDHLVCRLLLEKKNTYT